MNDDAEGQHAIDELNGAEYDGRTLSVSIAATCRKNRNNRNYGNRDYHERTGIDLKKILRTKRTVSNRYGLFILNQISYKTL